MHEFLMNIDNKEIFSEILHHSIDYLIGNRNDEDTLKVAPKYGFQSPDDFLVTTRNIARCYRIHAATEDDTGLLAEFSNISSELQRLVPSVLAARRPEVIAFLTRQQESQEYPLVESYDCDARIILGDSSFGRTRQVATVTLNCREANGQTATRHIEMTREKLDEFIEVLEQALKTPTTGEGGKPIADVKLN